MSTFHLEQILQETAVSEINFHRTMGSTNNRAIELIKSSRRLGFPLLVLTELQTAGKGQGNRKWLADQGSLTFSLCVQRFSNHADDLESPAGLGTRVSARLQSLLPLVVANAVCKAIESIGTLVDVKIKWPNDILIENRKVGGILIEHVSSVSGDFGVFVIGIGINVNNEIVSEQIGGNGRVEKHQRLADGIQPTNLSFQLQRSVSLNDLLIGILGQLESEFARAQASSDRTIQEVQQRLTFLGQEIEFQLADKQVVVGNCVGLGPNGELLIDTPQGCRAEVSGRVIRFGGNPN